MEVEKSLLFVLPTALCFIHQYIAKSDKIMPENFETPESSVAGAVRTAPHFPCLTNMNEDIFSIFQFVCSVKTINGT